MYNWSFYIVSLKNILDSWTPARNSPWLFCAFLLALVEVDSLSWNLRHVTMG